MSLTMSTRPVRKCLKAANGIVLHAVPRSVSIDAAIAYFQNTLKISSIQINEAS